MLPGLEQYHADVISGRQRGALAALLRGTLRAVEPVYAGVVAGRNASFSRLRTPAKVDRPVISVGNITTGGTGKTPVVRWLAEKLIAAGQRPAILLRGYRGGDEQRMLQAQLPGTIVHASPSRVEGARHVIQSHPQVTVFLLDDGFQHRQIARDFDLVLIDASNPFGFGHVLPRGLLREPLRGLRRASAFLVTRYERSAMPEIEATLQHFNPNAPIFRSRHAQAGLRSAGGAVVGMDALDGAKVISVCAIGNPREFEDQLRAHGATLAAEIRFPDHHRYDAEDVASIQHRARDAGATMIITTEKDWTKLQPLLGRVAHPVPVFRVVLEIQFEAEDESRLLGSMMAALLPAPAPAASG